MDIREVENMSADDLKANTKQLIEELKDEGREDLAKRYVQAQIDAKMRDEKLSEQGKTINALQDSIDDLRSVVASLEKARDEALSRLQAKEDFAANAKEDSDRTIAKAHADLDRLKKQNDQKIQSIQKTSSELADVLGNDLKTERERSNRLKGEAKRNQKALNDSAAILNNAIAAQQVENADSGE